MFAGRSADRPQVADLERIEALVRARFGVGGDDIVLITQEPGRDPGMPESMTTILFWTGRQTRHRLRLFKPAADVRPADLPPSWLRGALVDDGESDCC